MYTTDTTRTTITIARECHSSGQSKFLWGKAAHHAVWLMNCTLMKALDSITPLEATTGKKPNLRNLHEWGCQIWVQNEASAKLGGQVNEGIWVGYDDRSKGSQVYWPEKCIVMVEQNIYFNNSMVNSDCLEGEEEVLVKPVKSNPQNEHQPASTPTITPTPDKDQPQEHCTHMVSHGVQDIIDGRGTSSS